MTSHRAQLLGLLSTYIGVPLCYLYDVSVRLPVRLRVALRVVRDAYYTALPWMAK